MELGGKGVRGSQEGTVSRMIWKVLAHLQRTHSTGTNGDGKSSGEFGEQSLLGKRVRVHVVNRNQPGVDWSSSTSVRVTSLAVMEPEPALPDVTSALPNTLTSVSRGAAHCLRPTPAFSTASSASFVTASHHRYSLANSFVTVTQKKRNRSTDVSSGPVVKAMDLHPVNPGSTPASTHMTVVTVLVDSCCRRIAGREKRLRIDVLIDSEDQPTESGRRRPRRRPGRIVIGCENEYRGN